MTATDYQLDFNGTVIGNGTNVTLMDFSGFEQWSTRGSDVAIPNAWGSIPGSSYVDARVVSLSVRSQNTASILAFEAALIPPTNNAPDGLVPIRWKFPNREEFLCYGRCGRRNRVRSVESDTATLNWQFDFELEFPDPRVYSAVLQQASLTVFVAGSAALEFSLGATTNLAFDFSLGAGADLAFDFVGTGTSGLAIVTNNGYVATYPLIVVNPATGITSFTLTNQTSGQVLTINQLVPQGSTLIADMQLAQTAIASSGSAAPTVVISVNGTNVYGSWQPPRTPFALIPGQNILKYEVASGDPASTAYLTAPSGYL